MCEDETEAKSAAVTDSGEPRDAGGKYLRLRTNMMESRANLELFSWPQPTIGTCIEDSAHGVMTHFIHAHFTLFVGRRM